MACHWVGIDCGFSHMAVAILDETDRVLAVEHTREPRGDGHARDVALARLQILLARLRSYRDVPVRLAGYCYDHAGVHQAFRAAGWTIAGSKALNDVAGFYGLTDMCGNVVVGGCGSWSQVVYIDESNAVRWPGEDVAAQMPPWFLSGWRYAEFLVNLSKRSDAQLHWLRQAVCERLGGSNLEQTSSSWGTVGPLLPQALAHPEARQFLAKAAAAVVETRNLLWRYAAVARAPRIVLGGGAVKDEQLWAVLRGELQARGVSAQRVTGEPAVGLARFAKHYPDADQWAFVGRGRPVWL